MKFPSHLNCDGKIVSEMGPSTEFIDAFFMEEQFMMISYVIYDESFVTYIVNQIINVLFIQVLYNYCIDQTEI